jgi:glycosyltransferase involved in cell wall biosynthesis
MVVGRLVNANREKGTVDLLRAAQRTWGQGGRFAVVLAGPSMPNFEAFWKNYRPAGMVLRLGVLDARQKKDFFAGIDVFALPSRSDSFGLVFPEAWANGVPCIGYRAGGVPWVIQHGTDGLVVPCGDVAALAAALLRLAADAQLRQKMGQAGLEHTRHEFGWDEKFALVRRVYEELTQGAVEVPPR